LGKNLGDKSWEKFWRIAGNILKKIGETGLKDWKTVVSHQFDPSFTKREEKWWTCIPGTLGKHGTMAGQ